MLGNGERLDVAKFTISKGEAKKCNVGKLALLPSNVAMYVATACYGYKMIIHDYM